MSRTNRIKAAFVEFIPKALEPGVLYISTKYQTATHLCCCGCGNKVVTPLKPGGWTVRIHGDKVSLFPSIGNWSLPCQSHYWIRSNRVDWAPQWSRREIEAGRVSDQREREAYFDVPARESPWRRLLRRLFG